MAKKKAASTPVKKTAVKKVVGKKTTAQKLAAKKKTTNTKRSKRRKAPPSYNYCLTFIGKLGQVNANYYYELRECVNGNCGDLRGIVVSKSGSLQKSCKGAAVPLSPLNLTIWENGVQVLGCK